MKIINRLKLSVSLFTLLIALSQGCTSISSKTPNSLSYILSGNKFAEKGEYAKSADQYKNALKEEPYSSTAKRNLGLVYVKMNKFKEAANLLSEVSSAYPKDPELFYFLGEAYRGLSLEQKAIVNYRQSLSLAPNDSRTIKSLSWVYLKTGEINEAEKLIKKNYEKNPLDLQLLLIMSSIDVKKGRYSKAIKEMKEFEKSDFKIISRDKTTAETEKILLLNVLGNAYLGINDCVKAQKIFDLVLQSRPFLASTLTDSAKCDLKSNNLSQAMGKLEKAYSAEPDYPESLFLLGKIYTQYDPKKAVFYYKRFLELSSENQSFINEFKQAQASINSLESKNLPSSQKSD